MTNEEAISLFQDRIEKAKSYLDKVRTMASKVHKEGVLRGIELDTLAVEALRASEPRVLTRKELEVLRDFPVYRQDRYSDRYCRWEIWFGFRQSDGAYCKDYRLWTHKPTAEQMQATSWGLSNEQNL